MPRANTDRERGVPVWDLPTRLFHAALALAVVVSFVSHWLGERAFALHVASGSLVLTLVLFRIVWGFAGARYARFADFVRGPRAVLAHLRAGAPEATVGHNPLGGWMVLALLALLLVQACTGLFANDHIANAGPLYGLAPGASRALTRWHHRSAFALEILVPLHVAAVLYLSARRGHTLIRPMVSGRKPGLDIRAALAGERRLRALVVFLGLALALAALLWLAPEARLGLE
jgi:cytochrome b